MTEDRDVLELLEPLDDHAGPAARISSQRARAMVGAAVDRAAIAEAPVPASSTRRGRGLLVAAALVAVVGGASAAVYRAVVGGDRAPSRLPAGSLPDAGPPPDAGVPAPDAAPPAEVDIEFDAAVDGPRSAHRPSRTPPTSRDGAEDLLARANARRGARRWRDAAALYERVRREHPETTAAYVATVAAADLYLHQLDAARRALARYRAALRARPTGTLAAEARFGVAEAHRALGDVDAERAALEQLVDAHPDSLLRDRAEQRLRALTEARE